MRINTEAVIKILILIGFALFFLVIMQNGSVQLYVHPRIVPYMKFGAAAMVLIALFSAGEIFKPRRKSVSLLPYLVFIIPLFAAFALPAKPMNSNSLLARDVNLAQKGRDFKQYVKNGGPGEAVSGLNQAGQSESSWNLQPRKSLLEGDTIVMEEKNFATWLQELYSFPGDYEGKKIEVTGFVFKDKDFEENEFVTARFIMSCCTADAQVVGLMSRFSGAAEYKKDTWLKVRGKVTKIEYKGEVMPCIEVESVVSVPKPKNEYIYAY